MRAMDARRAKMEASWQTPDSEALERELRDLDDRLRVVFIEPRAGTLPPRMRGPGLIPGRWHIKVLAHPRNEYFPIAGPNWEYREPDLAVVEEMKARDMWKPGALDKRRRDEEQEERRRARAALTEAEQREDEVALAWRSAKRVSGEGGLRRRFDRRHRELPGVVPYAGRVDFETSDSGLAVPAGAAA